MQTATISQIYRPPQCVVILDKIRHAGSPIMKLVGLRELGPSPVAEAALREDGGDDVHLAQVDLHPFFGADFSANGRGGAPGAPVSVAVQP